MAMVFTILLLCSEHQATKHYVHHEIDALSDDPSVTSSAIGRTFSRRILIPGNHSYTLGRRQGHNFLRPPYASYLRERDNTCLLSSDIEHENHSNVLPQYESVVMTTMQRSNGRSEASGSNETSRRENISMAQPQLTQNSTSVESEETTTLNRESRTRSAVTRPHSQVFERRVHPIQNDNADRVNFSTLVGLQQPRNERRNVRRSASNSVVDDVRRQRRPRSRNRISEPNPLQERFVPAYDGSMLPVYTVPGSDEVFVNMRDIYAFQMPLSYPYEPTPSYPITAPSYVEEPPPYSPTEDTTGGLWSTQTFPGYHGNRCGRNSSTNSAFPLLDGLQCATLRTNQSENATETVRLNNLSRTPRHIACPRQPITRNIVDQSSPTTRRDSAELLEQRNNATENTESN
uniref:Uncharacterized protein LOC102809484 n=1 Tax=Saccoglossus kowalevskii TaxID=10224 RepID=A0ABM0MB18_SACKO